MVSIPLGVPLGRAYQALLWFLLALAATFLIIIIIVDLLLRALVVKPVAEISEMANKVSMGNSTRRNMSATATTKSDRCPSRSTACGAVCRMR